MTEEIAGIKVPDSAMTREITELVRETVSPLLFHHSSRVYYFGALAGRRLGLKFDPELLYAGCMFHDLGLAHEHSSKCCRFEVDGANAARSFLERHGIDERDVERVWTAIALHTTPGIPEHMHPLIALVTAGVETDVLGMHHEHLAPSVRDAVVKVHPRGRNFKEAIIQTFYDGISHKPQTTFGNVKADVISDKNPDLKQENFCSIIRRSCWPS
ncbi:HD domain-containing protein [Pseudomonas taiwanensis]|uniref:HD domain-containing protein n=1 Tax=Pseudomonas taiwanensis TaxID=470150 RepID=UPI0009DB9F2F|nr:HD domain-containing protein [Pseudomonas taiwanensis]